MSNYSHLKLALGSSPSAREEERSKPLKRQPLSESAKETKKAILSATAHILLNEGIERANTNLIAEKAGVSIGSLYQYYHNKEDIFEDLLNETLKKRHARVQAALDLKAATHSIPETVSRVVDAIFEKDAEDDIHLETLLWPLLLGARDKKTALTQSEMLEQVLFPVLKTLIAVKHPKLLKRDLDTLIFVLIQALRGVFLGLSLPKWQGISRQKLKNEVNTLILNYLEVATQKAR